MSDDDSYKVELAPRAQKDFKKLDGEVQRRIAAALIRIETDPFQGERLTNQSTGEYKWRVGDWRIRYDIDRGSKIVNVLRIMKRDESYTKKY
jgi:mRNA interferase RelE/StbE